MDLSKRLLLDAAKLNPEGLKRLAASLGLRFDGQGPRQIARLVFWRITRKQAKTRRRLFGE